MIFPAITTFTLLTLSLAAIHEENCDVLGRHFYEYLNCAPKYKPGTSCPVSYDCPKFEIGPDYCIFQNVRYKFGEEIQNTSYCHVGCYCDDYKGGDNPISCAVVDCLWSTPEDLEHCYEPRKPAGCCPGEKICEPYDNITKCELNGKTYMEGELMDTGDTCWLCQCQKGFKGILEEPYCIKEPCDTEIYNSKQLVDKCAPIYRKSGDKKALCCAWSFLCPSQVIDLKITSRCKNPSRGREPCTFMDTEFNVNDEFVATYKQDSAARNITCTCRLPPYVSCIET